MASRLGPHLEQISSAASSISVLPFPPPKMFTNAILRSTHITSLIRDTESHERILFTVPSAPPSHTATGSSTARAPRRNTAVAAMLGKDMVDQLRKGGAGGVGGGVGGVATGEVDVGLLLKGAETLVQNYPIPGGIESVSQLRSRFIRLSNSISALEMLVSNQESQLDLLNRQRQDDGHAGGGGGGGVLDPAWASHGSAEVTAEMLRREEEEIAELEKQRAKMEDDIKMIDMEMGRNIHSFGVS